MPGYVVQIRSDEVNSLIQSKTVRCYTKLRSNFYHFCNSQNMRAHHNTRRTNIFYLESEASNPSGFDCIIKDLKLSSEIKPKTSLLYYYINVILQNQLYCLQTRGNIPKLHVLEINDLQLKTLISRYIFWVLVISWQNWVKRSMIHMTLCQINRPRKP